MKFKATLSDRGLRVLEKGFLPTMEKFGKQCQLLLGPEDVHLIQTSLNADGLQITARLALEVLFEPGTYRVQSKHNNLIAFTVDIALMLKVLRSAVAHETNTVDMKLAMRKLPTSGGVTEQERPTLSFSWRGHNLQVLQDLPISKPWPAHEVDVLVRQKDITQLCPFYLDVQPEESRVQAIVDKLKGLASDVTLVTTKQGDLHLQVHSTPLLNTLLQAAAPGLHFGTEQRGLQVLPASVADGVQRLGATSAEGRLREGEQHGHAASVCVLVKHLSKALQSSQLTAPAQLLLGIAEGGGYIHVMFVYRDPLNDAGYDDNISLSYKLPVRDES